MEYGLNDYQVKGVLLAGNEIASLDMLIDERRLVESAPENTDPIFERYFWSLFNEKLAAALDTLTYREETVIRLYFGLDTGKKRSMEEVGREYDITRKRVRQILGKALRKLRYPTRASKIKAYYK